MLGGIESNASVGSHDDDSLARQISLDDRRHLHIVSSDADIGLLHFDN